MKKTNIKNLKIKGAISLAMALTVGSLIPSSVHASSNTPTSTAIEITNDDDKRDNEAFDMFKTSLLVGDLSNDTLSDQWNYDFFIGDKWRSLFGYLDNNILSKTVYKKEKNRDYSTYVFTDFKSYNKIGFKSFDVASNYIAFYQNDNRGFSEDGKLECQYLVAKFDTDNHITFKYSTDIDEKRKTGKRRDGSSVVIQYTPYTGELVVANYMHLCKDALIYPESWEKISRDVYRIPSNKNIDMMNQIITLYQKQSTPTDILDNLNSIVKGTYGISKKEVQTKPKTENKKNTKTTTQSTLSQSEKTFQEIANSISENTEVDKNKAKELMSSLHIESNEIKNIASIMINAMLSKKDYTVQTLSDDFNNSLYLASIDSEVDIIVDKENNFEDVTVYTKDENGKFTKSFSYYTMNKNQGAKKSESYELRNLSSDDKEWITVAYSPNHNNLTIVQTLNDEEDRVQVHTLDENMNDVIVNQMLSDYIDQADYYQIYEHALDISNGITPKQAKAYKK